MKQGAACFYCTGWPPAANRPNDGSYKIAAAAMLPRRKSAFRPL